MNELPRSTTRRPPLRRAIAFAALLLHACVSRPPDEVTIAVCQVRCVAGDFDGNLQRVERALAEAERRGARLACFPETTLLGWVHPGAHDLAAPIPGATTERLGELARTYGMMLAIGIAEKAGDRLYDSAVLLDRDGTILLHHRKVNILEELMQPPYTPGSIEQDDVVDTSLGRIGMLVCADTFKDDVVDAMARKHPDLLLVPYGWAAPENKWPEHGDSLRAWVAHTARRAGCPVVGVDVVGTIADGPWTGYVYGGQSVVCDVDGGVLSILADRQPEVRVVTVRLHAHPRQ